MADYWWPLREYSGPNEMPDDRRYDNNPDGEEAVWAFEAAAYRVWAQMLAQYRVESGGTNGIPVVAAAGSGD
jgi:hypothetical protein